MTDLSELHKRGIMAFESGKPQMAIDILGLALRTGSASAEIYADYGVINRSLGNFEIARENLEIAISKEPNNAEFYYNLALVCCDLGEIGLAEQHYKTVIDLNPDMVLAHNNLGNLRKDNNDFDSARKYYERAIELDPNYIAARKNLGDLIEFSGQYSEARDIYTRAFHIKPNIGARVREAMVLPVIMESNDHIEDCRGNMTKKIDDLLNESLRLNDPVREVGATNFFSAYHGLNDRPIQTKIGELYEKLCPSLTFNAPHARDWMPGLEGGVPRIGFVSSFFHSHTIAKLYKELINGLPNGRFEVFSFSFSNFKDEWSSHFESGNSKFLRLPRDLAQARQCIADAELDILYYTDIGMEPLTYFLAFARLAPIQCVSWGHPVTTGIKSIDYFISSKLIETEDSSEAYSEKLVKLDGLPSCVERSVDFSIVTSKRTRPGNNIFCPQSLFKYHPDFDELIGGVLRTIKNASLKLIDGTHPAWSKLLKKRMLKTLSDVSDRIEIIPRLNGTEFTQMLRDSDVILDTPHFSGGFTTYQSLAAGTPVVTVPGKYMRGRVSLGIYKQMKILDCIAEGSSSYIDITEKLCLDSSFSNKVRDSIKDNQQYIFDNRSAITQHSKFFEKVMFAS